MGNINVTEPDDDCKRMVRADEIRWTADSLPRLETIPEDADDLRACSTAALFAYARDLRLEAAGLRTTLHEALRVVRTQSVQIDRFQVRTLALIGELREARADARALNAQLRALQDEAA